VVSNRNVCEMLSFNLENESYDISTVSSKEGVKNLMQGHNLVLMDIMASDVSDFNRIKNILKKVEKTNNIAENFVKMGDLIVDISAKKVKVGDSEILLTRTEFEILLMFVSSPFFVFSHRQIADSVWINSDIVTSHTVDVHISRLRKKLGSKAHYIFSRPGFGYEFNPRLPKKKAAKRIGKR
jgi:two-component system alkaline phosphatase synthesis response regulator PhoP